MCSFIALQKSPLCPHHTHTHIHHTSYTHTLLPLDQPKKCFKVQFKCYLFSQPPTNLAPYHTPKPNRINTVKHLLSAHLILSPFRMVFITYITDSSFYDHLPIRLSDLGDRKHAVYISSGRGRRFIL